MLRSNERVGAASDGIMSILFVDKEWMNEWLIYIMFGHGVFILLLFDLYKCNGRFVTSLLLYRLGMNYGSVLKMAMYKLYSEWLICLMLFDVLTVVQGVLTFGDIWIII